MNIALILSGGTGSRMGLDIPKQYMEVSGRLVITYCVEQLLSHERIDGIQIVAASEWKDRISDWLLYADIKGKFKGFSDPGINRQLSIYHGLEDIRAYADESDYVFIHDAARPLLSEQMISSCLRAVIGHDGVLPVLPMKDTVYSSLDGKRISSLLNRNEIYAGQAPEVFQLGKYYEANMRLLPDEILSIHGSTEPAVLAGLDIAIINGDENNFKITTKADLDRFATIIKENKVQRHI